MAGGTLMGWFKGKYVELLLLGAAILDVATCDLCCKQFAGPGSNCGTDATCNNFCDGKKAFSRAECCPCPCPGRKDYPRCWGIRVTGMMLTTEKIFDGSPGQEGYYWQLMGDPTVPEYTDCNTTWNYNSVPGSGIGTSTYGPYTWNYYQPDGTLVDSNPGTVFMDVAVAELVFPADGSPPYVGVRVYATGNVGGGRLYDNVLVGSAGWFGDNAILVGYDPKLPPCISGTITGTTDVLVTDSGRAHTFPPPMGTSPPVVSFYPKCQNCDGTPCNPGSDPASRCAEMTFSGNVQVGVLEGDPVFEPVVVPLQRFGCGFSGTADGVSVTIMPLGSDCGPTYVDGTDDGMGDNHVGVFRWRTTVDSTTLGGGIGILDSDAFTYTACPNMPTDNTSGTISVTDASLDVGTNCGDPDPAVDGL